MDRYASFASIKELGDKPLDITKKTVSIVGIGAIGSAIAETLTRMGVNLRIIDKDRVDQNDLDKLSLFGEEHHAKFKAKEAKKLLEGLNKDVKIKAFHEELMKNNAYLIESDVVIDCTNNNDATLLADNARKKTPLIYVRAGGVEARVVILDTTSAKDVMAFLEKQSPLLDSKNVLPTTVQLVAAITVNKVLKILTGQRYEKNMLAINGWKFSVEKVPVRKK